MTAEEVNKFDYTAAVIEALRAAGGPISNEELWDRIMRHPDVPADDREAYWTPPFKPGPYPRNFLMFRIASELMMHADWGGRRPDAPLISTEEGYWLPEWGPIPLREQQRRAERAEEQARRTREPAPKVWPELDPYPKNSLASESELRDVAEKLVTFRKTVSGQRMVPVESSSISRIVRERLEEEGKLDESRRYHAERNRRIGVLMEWYGNAVRRTAGADPQDLFVLVSLGLIRDPEKTAPPTQQAPPSQSTPARQGQASTSTGQRPQLVTGSSQAEPQKDLVVLGLGFIVVMLLVVIILLITEQGASSDQGDGIYTTSENGWTTVSLKGDQVARVETLE